MIVRLLVRLVERLTARLVAFCLAASVCLLCVGVLPQSAWAQPPAAGETTAEARWRFERGLDLYNAADYRGALIEFQRAYELTGHRLLQLNVGLVHAKLGDSVACVRALGPLVDKYPDVLGTSLAIAQAAVAEHEARIGRLEVKTNVSEAIVRLNNIEEKLAPAQPLAVNQGEHVLSVFATGYEPYRARVRVLGRSKRSVTVRLMPLEEEYSQLTIRSLLPDVNVFSGQQYLGKTPLASSVALIPGNHELVFKRPGYVTERRPLHLYPGSSGDIEVVLKRDPRSAAETGQLTVVVDQPNAVLWVNGEPRPHLGSAIRLPVGRHRVRVQRSGYYDVQREVDLGTSTKTVRVALFPTSETLHEYSQSASRQRSWGVWGVLGGAAVATAGGVGLLLNESAVTRARRRFDAQAASAQASANLGCDANCEDQLAARLSALESAQDRRRWGWLALGAGAAAATTGALLWALGPDPERYSPEAGEFEPTVSFKLLPFGASLSGRF